MSTLKVRTHENYTISLLDGRELHFSGLSRQEAEMIDSALNGVNYKAELEEARNKLEKVNNQLKNIAREVSIIEEVLRGESPEYEMKKVPSNHEMKKTHYEAARKAHSFKSIWGIYAVDNLYASHTWYEPDAINRYVNRVKFIYNNTVYVRNVDGYTWLSIYEAIDRCVKDSGAEGEIVISGLVEKKESSYLGLVRVLEVAVR